MRLKLATTLMLSAVAAVPVAAQLPALVEPASVDNSAPRAIRFASSAAADGALVIVMRSAALPAGNAIPLDAASRAAVERAIASANYEGKEGKLLSLRGIGPHARILLVGTGSDGDAASLAREAGGRAAQELKDEAAAVTLAGAASGSEAAEMALGYALGQYRFDRYKTVGKSAPPTGPVTILTSETGAAEAAWRSLQPLAEGVTLARDLATEPANVIYPQAFVDRVRAAFGRTPGVTIEVLDEAALASRNMGSLLGVGQGSRRPPRLLAVQYKGAGNAAPVAFVGKGITFDSGGISIKPAAGMWKMKADMSGAAATMGAVLSLAKSRAPVNVVAIAALAENMPGGSAQRPGDVVRTMSGKTIEVLNTDAEGRLVLADANEYAVATYSPAAVVNIATLTGSITVALSDEYAGLFSRDERLATTLLDAGRSTGEELWRMPLHKNYAEDMKSEIADIKNVVEGGSPGAGLGAHFVGYFVPEATPWAHLDIAGVDWNDKGSALTPKGSAGFGVRLLDRMARDWVR